MVVGNPTAFGEGFDILKKSEFDFLNSRQTRKIMGSFERGKNV